MVCIAIVATGIISKNSAIRYVISCSRRIRINIAVRAVSNNLIALIKDSDEGKREVRQ